MFPSTTTSAKSYASAFLIVLALFPPFHLTSAHPNTQISPRLNDRANSLEGLPKPHIIPPAPAVPTPLHPISHEEGSSVSIKRKSNTSSKRSLGQHRRWSRSGGHHHHSGLGSGGSYTIEQAPGSGPGSTSGSGSVSETDSSSGSGPGSASASASEPVPTNLGMGVGTPTAAPGSEDGSDDGAVSSSGGGGDPVTTYSTTFEAGYVSASASPTSSPSPAPSDPSDTGSTPSLTSASSLALPTTTQSIAGSTLTLTPVEGNGPAVKALTREVYRHRAQMGVNLGGWFVAEEWMQNNYFQCATNDSAEINIAEGCSQEWMENHWDTWITEQDFALMASTGVNTARLPVGYWSVGADNCNCENTAFWPYMSKYAGSWERVLRAIGWAAEYGIGILLDMHGVEGSQNGWAHSDIRSGKVLFPYNTEFQAHTIEVYKYMASTLVGLDNVVGFELVNEPFPSPLNAYTAFYDAAMAAMRPILGDDFPFYMFTNTNNWNIWMKKQSGFLVSDYHNYYVFGSLPNDNLVQVTNYIATTTAPSLNSWAPNLIIGEWTCAPGNVHEGSAEDLQAYCAAQMALYMSTEIAGNHYWNWKMAGGSCNGWSFQDQTGISGRCTGAQNLQPMNGATSFTPGADIATLSGNSNAIVVSTALVSSSHKTSRREMYRRDHGDKAEIWEHGCRIAQVFGAANSKLGFESQWLKSKGRESMLDIDEAGYLMHFKAGLAACA